MASIKELVILSWNILDGGQDRLDKITNRIRTLKPNIVTIQEVIDWDNEKLKLFSKEVKLPYFTVSQPSFNSNEGKSHAVIFSTYSLKDISKFDGSNHGIVGATIKTEIGDVRFYGIHLHSKDDSIKFRGLLSVHKDAKRWSNVIIAGDFNSLTRNDSWITDGFVGDKGYGVMEKAKILGYQDGFLQLHNFEVSKKLGEAHTYPSRSFKDRIRKETNQKEPRQRIDYVLVSKSLIARLKSIAVLRIGFSDHDPLYCKIDLN